MASRADAYHAPMPIMGYPKAEPFPWALLQPRRQRALRNHGQTLERLRNRGGLAPDELVAVLEDRPWRRMTPDEAFTRLRAILAGAGGS